MDKVLNYQMSLFGMFTNVQPNLELTMKIFESLKDEGFVPGTVQVNTVNPIENRMISETRLQLITADRSWSVVFFAERIDINYSFQGGDTWIATIDEVSSKVKRICDKAFAPIAATTGTRLAVNGQFLLKEMDDKTKKKFISRFLIQPKVYNGGSLAEWSVHYNSLTDIHTNDTSLEKCNFIINIGDIIGVDTKTGTASIRTSVGLDINTSPQNTENKYTVIDLLYFSEGAAENMKKAIDEIEGV